MVNQFAAPPINPIISVQPLVTPQAERDASRVPSELANLPNGTTVEGFVVNRDAHNNPILRTPLGDILIKSDIFIKTSSVVIFRIDATQASRARIITIDGLVPADYAAQQTRTPQGDTVTQSLLPVETSEMANLQQSQVKPVPPPSLRAVLLAPATASGKPEYTDTMMLTPLSSGKTPVPLILQKLQTGTLIKITVLKIELPLITPMGSAPEQLSPHALAQPSTPTMVGTAPNQPLPTLPSPNTSLSPTWSQPAASPSALPSTPASPTVAMVLPIPPSPITAAVIQPAPLSLSGTIPLTAGAIANTLHGTAASPTTAAPNEVLKSAPQMIQTPPVSTYQTIPSSPIADVPPMATTPYTGGAKGGHAATIAPSKATAIPTPSSSGLPAIVIGHEQDGATILHTPFGTLKTFTAQPLPTGTKLVIRAEPQAPTAVAATASTPLSEPMEEIASLARDWKNLSETIQWLQANNTPLAQALAQQLPEVGSRLTSGLLFFMAAIKGGDLRQWLSTRIVSELEKNAPELLSRLRGDMTQMQQLVAEAPGRNWSMAMLPMFYDGQLDHARLFFRQEDEPTAKEGKSAGKNHRFILEVDLSHLGSLQFDGFVRNSTRRRSFDLVIRSARMLDDTVIRDIRALFDTTVQTTAYKGQLIFQQGSQHFVRPLANLTESGSSTQPILA